MKNKKVFLAVTLICVLLMLAACSQPKSAYDIAVENGFQGSEQDWLASIKGDEGESAYRLYCELFGYEGTEEQWLIDLRTGALISFRVTFDLNGGQAPDGFVSSMTVRGGSFLDLKVPTKEGYTFLGWYTGDGDTDFAMTAITAVRSDLSLKAKWRSNVMSVRFLDKDGKLLKQETVPYGGAATAPQAPEVAQFLFNKWDVDFSVVTEDLIVKAVYSPLYKLSFNTDGGTMIADATYCAEDIPVAPVNPRKEGLVFRGWYADKEFTVPYDFSTPLTQNTTIYAYFSDLKPISNAEELKAIGDNSTGKFYLTNDIDLSGEIWIPLNGFAGEFDGQGYKIHNFIISETKRAGFFTTNNGTIQNLTLADFAFTVSTVDTNITFEAGALVGTNDGTIDNCHVKDAVLTYHWYRSGGNTYCSFAGGIVGDNEGIITNCTVEAKASCKSETYIHLSGGNYTGSGQLFFGGVAGKNSGTITRAVSALNVEGVVTGTGNGGSGDYAAPYLNIGGCVSNNCGELLLCESYITLTVSTTVNNSVVLPRADFGGFVYTNSGTISECSAKGSLDTTNALVWNICAGGFAAINEKQIDNCYADVTIKTAGAKTTANDENQIGGFVGYNVGTIKFSYTTATVKTTVRGYIGGFSGKNVSGGTISKCFATGDITYEETSLGVGLFVGIADEGSTLFKNYYSAESKILQGETDITVEDANATAADRATFQSRGFLVDTLGWNTEVWEIVDGQYPMLIENK